MLKKYYFFLIIIVFIIGCNNNNKTGRINADDFNEDLIKIEIVDLIEYPELSYHFKRIKELDSKYYKDFCNDVSLLVFTKTENSIAHNKSGKGFLIYFSDGNTFVISNPMINEYPKRKDGDIYYSHTIIDEQEFDALLNKYLMLE